MKRQISMALILLSWLYSCKQEESIKNMKDLEQSMMDLKIYQENLGDNIDAGKLEDADWLLQGLDSILITVSATITEHHKLQKPFSYYKKRYLDKPMDGLHASFKKNDTALARKNYILLVDKCNDCHIDLEIDKDVKY